MAFIFLVVGIRHENRVLDSQCISNFALRASGSVRTSRNARLPDARPDAELVDVGNNEDEMAS